MVKLEISTNKEKPNTFLDRYRMSKMDLHLAEGNMRVAFWFSLFSLAVTTFFALSTSNYLFLADSFLIAIFAFGVYKKSVTSSILLFVYFLLSKLYQWIGPFLGSDDFGVEVNTLGVIIGIVMLNAFFLGMLGAIRYRKIAPKNKLKKTHKWALIVIIAFISLLVAGGGYFYLSQYNKNNSNLTDNIKSSVVNIFCTSPDGEDFDTGGSGVMLDKTGIILTNNHIIPNGDNGVGCMITLPNVKTGAPENIYWAYPIVVDELSEFYDLAYLKIYSAHEDEDGYGWGEYPREFNTLDNLWFCSTDDLNLGDPVVILGYPSLSGGINLTVTDGIISGFTENDEILTSAQITPGNSGGAAISPDKNCFIGIPSYSFNEDIDSLGGIISTNLIEEFSSDTENGEYKITAPEWAVEL